MLHGDLAVVQPILSLVATALVIMIADFFLPDDDARPPALLALLGIAGSALLSLQHWGAGRSELVSGFGRGVGLEGAPPAIYLIEADRFSVYAGLILLASAALVVLMSWDYLRRRPGLARAEYYILILLVTAAMMLSASANDLILIFLAIETFSIGLYVLSGFLRDERPSQEAALKYFVLGAIGGAFMLYGIALTYAGIGTTNLTLLRYLLSTQTEGYPGMLFAGLGLIAVGLGFKIAMAPFHQWTPDVYQGAPTTITAFMSASTKVAAFAALLRVLWVGFESLAADWMPLLAGLAALTMIVGNLGALVQADMKRMLAYSAVAHAGYLLVAVVAGGAAGRGAMLFYLLLYALMNLGAFASLLAIGGIGAEGRDATELDDLKGLAKRHPGLALALALFLLSLVGLPPTAGFMGKWYIFLAAIGSDLTWLAVIMILASVVSAFYYLRPVVMMYMAEADESAAPLEVPTASAIAIALCALMVGGALILARPLVAASENAAMAGLADAGATAGSYQAPIFIPAPDKLDERMRDKAERARESESSDQDQP